MSINPLRPNKFLKIREKIKIKSRAKRAVKTVKMMLQISNLNQNVENILLNKNSVGHFKILNG